MNPHTIGFFIASNAVPEQVEILIDDIRNYFGIEAEDDGVSASATLDNTGQASGTVVLDSNGLPWDERIHSGTKGKNKDGSWKKRKNVDDATVNRISAELRAAVSANAGTTVTTTAPPAPAAPAAPGGLAAPAAPAAPQLSPFQLLTQKVGPLVNEGVLTNDWLNQVAEFYGIVGGWPNLAVADAAKIAEVEAYIKNALAPLGRTL